MFKPKFKQLYSTQIRRLDIILVWFNFWHVFDTFYLSNDQAEIDGGRGMAVMVFHVEGNLENLVQYNA